MDKEVRAFRWACILLAVVTAIVMFRWQVLIIPQGFVVRVDRWTGRVWTAPVYKEWHEIRMPTEIDFVPDGGPQK